ncbi:MAG: MFS transporter, partial [Candidatus Omnitrophica bacterium]|nr:MFS transporter [Candidatus Omnitrophota bacterium]
SFHSLIRFNFIKAILIIAVVCALMMSVFVSFLPSLAAMINVNAFHVGAILSMGIFLAGILQVPFGRIADSHDLNGKLIQIGIGTSIGMLALFVMPLCPDFAALMAAASFVGLGAAVASPALTSVSVGIGKKTGMGSWMGIFQCAMSIGFVVTPLVAGIVMDRLGIEAVFYTLAICAFFGALSYLRYVLRRIHGYKIG